MSPLTAAVTGGELKSLPSTPATPGGTRSTRPTPKPKLIRKNSRVMQKHRVNKLALSDHAKCVLKRAASWYGKYVNANIAGMSLLKPGVKGDHCGGRYV